MIFFERSQELHTIEKGNEFRLLAMIANKIPKTACHDIKPGKIHISQMIRFEEDLPETMLSGKQSPPFQEESCTGTYPLDYKSLFKRQEFHSTV